MIKGDLLIISLKVLTVIGEVKGKTAILIDDMIDTGGTICSGANLLKKEGANRIFACASHAVFSPPSYERLSTKNLFEQVIVTNSIPVIHKDNFPQLKVLSVANMLGKLFGESTKKVLLVLCLDKKNIFFFLQPL